MRKTRPGLWLLVVLFGLSVCSIGACGALLWWVTPARVAAVHPDDARTIGAPALVKAYATNEVDADLSYQGQPIVVSGAVDRIGKDLANHAYVTLDGESGFRDVQCVLTDASAMRATSLTPGQAVRVFGRVRGLMVHVILERCEIL